MKVKLGNLNEECNLDSIVEIVEAYFSGNLEGLLSIEPTEEKMKLPTRKIKDEEVIHAYDFWDLVTKNPAGQCNNSLYLTGNMRLYNKIRNLYQEFPPFLELEISAVSISQFNAGLVNLPRLKDVANGKIDPLVIGNVVTHELGHGFGLFDYYIPYGHDPHCLMIQSSGNIKKLYKEITSRKGFCEDCRDTMLAKQIPTMERMIKTLKRNLFLLPRIKHFRYDTKTKILHDTNCEHKLEENIELAFRYNPKEAGYKLCDVLEEKYKE